MPSRRMLGRAAKASLGRAFKTSAVKACSGLCYQGEVGFCAWPAELSRELMVLDCLYLAGRSGLVPFHRMQAVSVETWRHGGTELWRRAAGALQACRRGGMEVWRSAVGV